MKDRLTLLPPTHRPTVRALLWLALLPSLQGCGPQAEGMSVRGKVTYAGEAVTDGTLTFFPTSGRPISVVISGDGEYSVDLPRDSYRVTVAVGGKLPSGWQEGQPVPKPAIVLPKQYSSRKNTPLKLAVSDELNEPVDFSLE